MTIVKWKRPSYEGQLNNPAIFNSPFSGLFENFLGGDFLTRDYASFVPAVNVSEEQGHYLLELSAPGFQKEDFKIELKDGVLVVSAQHQISEETKNKNYTRKEFAYGSFQRNFSLPEEANEETIDAKYENGILKISLTKKEEVKKTAKEIKIS